MKIENQVCTIEQAKMLHKLGVKKHLSFLSYWPNPRVIPNSGGAIEHDGTYDIMPTTNKRTYACDVKDSAFTVAELGVMLPDEVRGKTKGLTLYKYRRNDGLWFVYYSYTLKNELLGQNEILMEDSITNYNESIAVADMLIYLLENKLTTPEEVNNRLKD